MITNIDENTTVRTTKTPDIPGQEILLDRDTVLRILDKNTVDGFIEIERSVVNQA
ncbi:MAG: hypothetical protein IMF15_08170 [Proteobacteria bacterium]|jgi:hypothetical protein|nr:hypothetical protein [Pseudomonadota bacterium]